ncbi:Hypothetical protein EIN_442090, partial [Entamoeba invadens IP1]
MAGLNSKNKVVM